MKPTRASRPTTEFTTLVWLTSVCASCTEATSPTGYVDLDPVAVSQVPPSRNTSIALASEGTACVIDSYQTAVVCTGRDDGVVGVFGGEGEGPGEFRTPLAVVPGPDATIGVIDGELQRLSVFRPTGELISDARLPGVFTPAGPMTATLIGMAFDMQVEDGSLVLRNAQTEVDVASGEILWQRVFPDTQAQDDAGCEPVLFGGLLNAAATPTGRMVFSICDAHLLFFSDRDAGTGTLVKSPTYTAELPNRRDMEEHEEGLRDGGYAGTVRVRDRAHGFDILGQTLAVLVERQVGPADADGIADRAIDWYDVSRLDLGLARPQADGLPRT